MIHKLIGSDNKNYLYNDENDNLYSEDGAFVKSLGAKITKVNAGYDNGMIIVKWMVEEEGNYKMELNYYRAGSLIGTHEIPFSETQSQDSIGYPSYSPDLAVVCILKKKPLIGWTYKEVDRKTVSVISGTPPEPTEPLEFWNVVKWGSIGLLGYIIYKNLPKIAEKAPEYAEKAAVKGVEVGKVAAKVGFELAKEAALLAITKGKKLPVKKL